jgi:hypothetical protein
MISHRKCEIFEANGVPSSVQYNIADSGSAGNGATFSSSHQFTNIRTGFTMPMFQQTPQRAVNVVSFGAAGVQAVGPGAKTFVQQPDGSYTEQL